MKLWRIIREDIACGAGLLTRLPLGWLRVRGQAWSLPRSVWCWPLVGAFTGVLAGTVFLILRALHVPATIAAVWSIGIQVLLTGGLHEDGLADMADGCGGGSTLERRLEIMRDSRIGSYGALALGICLLIRVTALAALPVMLVLPALALAGALSRAMLPLLPFTLRPARENGLARQLIGLTRDQVLGCLFSAFCVALLCVSSHVALLACLLALCVACVLRATAKRLLNGYTGDVLGATASITDCVVLTALVAVWNG
ncbi:adenosylcobinamide-GDP ribazoletransferase [Gluconobacter frateurii]|uniref:Adenosylcobinamide-GDP ribazoletransferase n=1 Tax=Gluconobacter frateurii NRIC 0228 TaxID=1307946 RepID=A0ABQ0QF22_9PROT|nr:adenosylcobinamide-GDP ribazoletransferase [Gluconobacter frateurii]GBR16526.1 cobalamin synthase [Gluconobacter frateurii NRIC 0228]GLP90595.1 adenosylcobinamide-GDP ribazoletransferase [Gluconobacter frateurii]